MAGVLSRASSEEIRTVRKLSLANSVRREKALLYRNTNDGLKVSVVQRTGSVRKCDVRLEPRETVMNGGARDSLSPGTAPATP
jgi:hypothetical protein